MVNQNSKPWYKKTWVIVVGVFLLLILIGNFAGGSKQTSNVNSTNLENVKVDSSKIFTTKDSMDLVKTKSNFSYKNDEFQKVGWYTHKLENTSNRNTLMAKVNSTGYIYLEDQFYGEDWIFHTHVEVKIGDNIYKSDDVKGSDNERENSGGDVWETITYSNGKDNGILQAIAENSDKQIKVRFVGDQHISDFILSTSDKNIIRDSYNLSNLIKKSKKIS